MNVKKCSIEGCNYDHYAKGLCFKHYMRLWRKGTTTLTDKTSKIIKQDKCIIVVANNTKNKFIFDNTDKIYKVLKNKSFSENGKGYLFCYDKNNKLSIFAHNLILPKKEGYIIDHINGNIRDNRLLNLRYVTYAENNLNNHKNKIVGVGFKKDAKKWRAYIGYNKKQICLGLFDNIEDAIKARKQAEILYYPNLFANKYQDLKDIKV